MEEFRIPEEGYPLGRGDLALEWSGLGKFNDSLLSRDQGSHAEV